MSSIHSIEKGVFSDFHKSFNRLLLSLSKEESISKSSLVDLLKLNQDINKLVDSIDKVNYNLLKKKSNNQKLSKKQKEFLDDFEKEQHIIKEILPYLLYRHMNT